MPRNEAQARIKINHLLEQAGWRFFDDENGAANICLEPNIKLTSKEVNNLGNDFTQHPKGYVDFLLLNAQGAPFIVLEAKSEGKEPLAGKEQARTYARSLNCRFVILSNGNLHYFWDLEHGNPYIITRFPSPDSLAEHAKKYTPNSAKLVSEPVATDYITLTQHPNYQAEAGWQDEEKRANYIQANKLRFLRDYQLRAVRALQTASKKGNDRFLFEMATGTGKTLVSAAIIKLFLRTGNANRVLFLVDRLELEEQARKAFSSLLSKDYKTVIYKENRDDWRHAEIVVTTVQSLLFNNKYQDLFLPTDFNLIISDEAHRSISGNARAVFEYFFGYKLGLTATPRDYLRSFNPDATTKDPREHERRLLLDTYRTFGCESGIPTFRYSLSDAVKEGYLINPIVVDARSEVTTKLLSEEGFVATYTDDEGEDQQQTYKQREFEKRFFSDATNKILCKTFLENALPDPISGEIGKSIIFTVSQSHAAKITQILNQMADRMFPNKYNSDFAVQVTSHVQHAQRLTINFANNNLCGNANFNDAYRTSKARVCVTVGMMTTGYDCPDVLNLGMFRPIFSPTDFVQIKGRGTRKHCFLNELNDPALAQAVTQPDKTAFKLFDFFGNYEYFEEEFNYDEVIDLPSLPRVRENNNGNGGKKTGKNSQLGFYIHLGEDPMESIEMREVRPEGMRIDRMFFGKFEKTVKEDENIVTYVEAGEWDKVIDYVNKEVFNKPEEYYNLDKLRATIAVDRRLTLREILEKVFGFIPRFKLKDELLEEEFAKFVADYKPEEGTALPAIKYLFKSYIIDSEVRNILEKEEFSKLNTNPVFTTHNLKAVPKKYRKLVPEYIKDYVPLNQFI